MLIFVVRSEHNYLRSWADAPGFACSLNAVHTRHHQIHQHYIRNEILYQTERFLARTSFTHHIQVGLGIQKSAHTSPHNAMIIHNQYRDLLCHSSIPLAFTLLETPSSCQYSFSIQRAVRRVPSPIVLSTSIVPSSAS